MLATMYVLNILKLPLGSETDCFLQMKDTATGTTMVPWSNNQLKSYVNEEQSCHITARLKKTNQTTKKAFPL